MREARGDAVHVVADGRDVWIPADSFERMADREAREKRAAAVAGFAPQPARAVESCPILLAPDYGAARWGTLDDGEDVDVVLADHDFFGVRLAGKILAFVPARSVRLLPSAVPAIAAGPSGRGVVPEVQPLGRSDRDREPGAPARAPGAARPHATPPRSRFPTPLRGRAGAPAGAARLASGGSRAARPRDARGCPIPGGGAPAESERRGRPAHRRGGERHRGQDRRAQLPGPPA